MTLVVPQHFGHLIHSLRWEDDAELMAVTIGVASDDADSSTLGTLVDRFAQAFVDNILPVLLENISLVQTELSFQVDAPPDPPNVAVSTITGIGSHAGSSIPQNTAILVHKRTASGGRGGRGRWYLPSVSESVVSAIGALDGTFIDDVNAALDAYLSDVVGVAPDSAAVLLHSTPGAFAADDPHPITVMTCDPTVATQRRRLRK